MWTKSSRARAADSGGKPVNLFALRPFGHSGMGVSCRYRAAYGVLPALRREQHLRQHRQSQLESARPASRIDRSKWEPVATTAPLLSFFDISRDFQTSDLSYLNTHAMRVT